MSGRQKLSVRLTGTVQQIIPAIEGVQPEKAQIAVQSAEELYKEIRVENNFKDENGESIALKKGDEVEITIGVDKAATTPKGR